MGRGVALGCGLALGLIVHADRPVRPNLRHPAARSVKDAFSTGSFEEVVADLTEAYVRARYGEEEPSAEDLAALRRQEQRSGTRPTIPCASTSGLSRWKPYAATEEV